jgi:hypothetical protein
MLNAWYVGILVPPLAAGLAAAGAVVAAGFGALVGAAAAGAVVAAGGVVAAGLGALVGAEVGATGVAADPHAASSGMAVSSPSPEARSNARLFK